MFRLWAKEMKDNHIVKDTVICIEDEDTRTHKVFRALTECCRSFDLAEPLWLDTNISEFKRSSRTRFGQECFVELLDYFDYLEIQIIEED